MFDAFESSFRVRTITVDEKTLDLLANRIWSTSLKRTAKCWRTALRCCYVGSPSWAQNGTGASRPNGLHAKTSNAFWTAFFRPSGGPVSSTTELSEANGGDNDDCGSVIRPPQSVSIVCRVKLETLPETIVSRNTLAVPADKD